jgi:rhodanese-related sulfurtransferase
MLRAGETLHLLDVREALELRSASLGEKALHAPMSALVALGLDALPAPIRADKHTPVVVVCHHGIRSAQVGAWLAANGWEAIFNLAGGIDAYALTVDPSVGRY